MAGRLVARQRVILRMARDSIMDGLYSDEAVSDAMRAPGWAVEDLGLTELERWTRDACFCCAR